MQQQQHSHELVTLEGSWRTPSFDHARVADVMRFGVLACPPDASLRTVGRMMAANHVHSVMVTPGGDAPVAVISEHELLAAAGGADADERTAESLAVDPVAIMPDAPIAEAVKRMLDQRVSHLLVVDHGGRAVGVISALDVAGVLAWGEA